MIELALAAAFTSQMEGAKPAVALRAATVSAFLDFEQCLSVESFKAGGFNRREARTVVQSVLPKCATEWRELGLLMLSGESPSGADQAQLDYFRSLAVGKVASDLVVAREGSCGTEPGPYQCRGR